jgi:hypothetical protein
MQLIETGRAKKIRHGAEWKPWSRMSKPKAKKKALLCSISLPEASCGRDTFFEIKRNGTHFKALVFLVCGG